DTVSLADVLPELRPQLQRDLTHFQRIRRALRRSSPTRTAPLLLGRFQVGRELGRGAFGVVFLAPGPVLHRDVAIKVPRADALVTPELRERFQREAQAAAGLDHPNIVPVYEGGTMGPLCFVVSAYCPGPNLAQWLQQQTEPVPFRQAGT